MLRPTVSYGRISVDNIRSITERVGHPTKVILVEDTLKDIPDIRLFNDYPADGYNLSITFNEKDYMDIKLALLYNPDLAILQHILDLIDYKLKR